MKKVLVTGATGFIGGYVIEALLSRGLHVIATSSNREKASFKNWFPRVDFFELDLTKFDAEVNYYDYFNKPDMMIHLAWEGLPNYLQEFHLTENLPRHEAFLSNMIRHGLKDLTVSGTCFEYGMINGCMGEAMETFPENPYAQAKDNLRKSIESLRSSFEFSFKWVRLFYMYGEGQNPKSLIAQLDKALKENQPVFNMSGGMQKRDFLPVSKVAEYLVAIATQNDVEGIVNCCSGTPITVKEFVMNYLATQKKTIELNLGYYDYSSYEPMEFWGDNTKLKSIINL